MSLQPGDLMYGRMHWAVQSDEVPRLGYENLPMRELWYVEAVGNYIQPYCKVTIQDTSGSWHDIYTLRVGKITLSKPVEFGSSPAQSGAIRLGYGAAICARNSDNTGDVEVVKYGANGLELGGSSVPVRLKSAVFTETSSSPFSVSSSALVVNLNADQVDGKHASEFASAAHSHSHADLTGVSADQHHSQVHSLDGSDHTGTLSWSKVNKSGSSLADIATRNHNDLQSIQGGTTGEYYHLTQSQLSSLTGGGNTSLHLHDDRYSLTSHTHSHSSLTGITADQHHAQVHGLDSADHTGTLSWGKVNKTGSSLTDIATRNHNDLQSIQGGASGEYYHLTQSQLSGLTGGTTTSLHKHDRTGVTRPSSGAKTVVGFASDSTSATEFSIGLSSTYDIAPGHDHPYASLSHTHTKSQITDFAHDISGSDHSGTLAISKGGTGRSSFTSGYVLVGGSSQIDQVAPISTGTYTVDYVTPSGQYRRLTFTKGVLTADTALS